MDSFLYGFFTFFTYILTILAFNAKVSMHIVIYYANACQFIAIFD